MKYEFHPYLFIKLAATFILFTVIGTLSHEYGHIIVAEGLGYETSLHYGSMGTFGGKKAKLSQLYKENTYEIQNELPFAKRAEYDKLLAAKNVDSLLITWGGPVQTMLTGLLGFVFILFRKDRIALKGPRFIDWVGIFLSLFWLREVSNVFMSIASEFIRPNGSYFGGDEAKLSLKMSLHHGFFSIIFGCIGLCIAAYVILRIVPKQYRVTFILSGFLGGITGFILWMKLLGPVVLP